MGLEENNLLDGSSNPPLPQQYQSPPPQQYQPQQQQQQGYAYQSPPPQSYGAPPPQPYGAPAPGYGAPAPGYGYDYQGAPGEAVIVGVAPGHGDHHHQQMLHEDFGHQIKHYPGRALSALIKPHVHHYEQLKLAAAWPITFFILFLQIILGIIFVVIANAMEEAAWNDFKENNPGLVTSSEETKYLGLALGATIGVSIAGRLGMFFVQNGVCHAIALCLGGGKHNGQSSTNMFLQLCFINILYGLPIDLLSGFLGLIPAVGPFIAFALFVYGLVLFVISLRAIYDITTCHAIGVIITFAIVFAVVMIVLIFAFAASLSGIALAFM